MELIKFNEDNVKLNVKSKNWEDAIRKSIGILERNNNVDENYIDHILKDIEEYGPYIIIHPGLAIPHSRPENGVIEIGFGLITLDTPVYFKNNTNPVEVLISFAATDNEKHLDIIRLIVNIVQKGLIESILQVQTVDELNLLLKGENIL